MGRGRAATQPPTGAGRIFTGEGSESSGKLTATNQQILKPMEQPSTHIALNSYGPSDNWLRDAVLAEASHLPFVGSQSPAYELILVHYDKSRKKSEISGGKFTWTNTVTESCASAYKVTGEQRPHEYRAAYVIRVGIPQDSTFDNLPDFLLEQKNSAIGRDWALEESVSKNQWALIPIKVLGETYEPDGYQPPDRNDHEFRGFMPMG
jgi:hypothetical protein